MVIVMKCSTVEYVLLKRRHDIRVGISDANGLSPDDARKIPKCLARHLPAPVCNKSVQNSCPLASLVGTRYVPKYLYKVSFRSVIFILSEC